MKKQLEKYKRYIFVGIILIALGVTFSTTVNDNGTSLGSVLIALGGLFFIIGMKQKRDADEKIEGC
jgi:hypothetical protein